MIEPVASRSFYAKWEHLGGRRNCHKASIVSYSSGQQGLLPAWMLFLPESECLDLIPPLCQQNLSLWTLWTHCCSLLHIVLSSLLYQSPQVKASSWLVFEFCCPLCTQSWYIEPRTILSPPASTSQVLGLSVSISHACLLYGPCLVSILQ